MGTKKSNKKVMRTIIVMRILEPASPQQRPESLSWPLTQCLKCQIATAEVSSKKLLDQECIVRLIVIAMYQHQSTWIITHQGIKRICQYHALTGRGTLRPESLKSTHPKYGGNRCLEDTREKINSTSIDHILDSRLAIHLIWQSEMVFKGQ